MKNLMIISVVFLMLIGSSCKNEEVILPAEKTTYDLKVRDMLGVTGTITFTETSLTAVTIDIQLTGAPAGTHPAEICANSAIEGGTTAVVLNPVDTNGKSTTLTSTMTYKQLIAYDGFAQVHLNNLEPNN
ncbi:hypothetical protein JZU68_05125, partial [bacterium]|nr:hypothetical protein [bacterium]